MKKLILFLSIFFITISAFAQFEFKNGKSMAKMDTLITKGDTLFLVNKTTKAICKAVVVNGALKVQNIYTFTDTLTKYRLFVDSIRALRLTTANISLKKDKSDSTALSGYKTNYAFNTGISGKKDNSDTILRTGYMTVGRANDSIKALSDRIGSGGGGEPLYIADSAGIKAPIRALPTTYLGISATSTNSALLQGKDSTYIKANWGNEALYVGDSAYIKSGVRSISTKKANNDSILNTGYKTNYSFNRDTTLINSRLVALQSLTDTTSELVARTIYVSMPTDAQTPGSDVTGTGSVSLPFSTINKALSTLNKDIYGAITIQLDSGEFNYTKNDVDLINKLSFKYSITTPNIKLIGIVYPIITGITATVDAINPYKWNTTTNFGANNYATYFFGTSGSYSPIESNTANQLTTTATVTGTAIYKMVTKINFATINIGAINIKSDAPSNCNIQFENCEITTTNNTLINNNGGNNTTYVRFWNCLLTAPRQILFTANPLQFFWFEKCFLRVSYNSSTNVIVSASYGTRCSINRSVFKNELNSGIGVLASLGSDVSVGGNIFSNLTSFSSGAETGSHFHNKTTTNFFKNVVSIFTITTAFDVKYILYVSNYLYFENCTNLFDIVNKNNSIEWYQPYTLVGVTNVFSTASISKEFYCPSKKTYIYIKGTYPEYEQKQSYTLANNSTDSVSIADLTYNRTITINYNIVRNGVYRAGTMKVLNDGTNYYFDPGEFFPAANDLGIVFNGVYRSGSSNTLKLKWTTSNTGYAATMIIDYNRQNF
jgi:hypothetical protein